MDKRVWTYRYSRVCIWRHKVVRCGSQEFSDYRGQTGHGRALGGAVVMTMSHKINPPALTWPKVSAGRVCQTIVRPSPVAFVPPAMPT